MDHYVSLLSRVQAKSPELVKDILERILELFRSAAVNGPWRHFEQGARFFAASVAAGLVAVSSFTTLCDSLLQVAESGGIREGDFALWVLLLVLPVAGSAVLGPIGSDYGAKVTAAMTKRSALKQAVPRDLATVWMLFEGAMSSASGSVPISAFSQTLDLNLPRLVADSFWDGDFEALSLFPDAYALGDGTECGHFEKWTLLLGCRHLVESMELNHRQCADLLLNGLSPRFLSPEKIIAQFLFGELLRSRVNGMANLVYETLLIDACRLSRAFPPAMAKGLQALFGRLDELGFVATDRLATWFAHHLSNFDFKWPWDRWSAVLTAPPTSMQHVFVRFTLEKLLRLSYRDRIMPTLPPDFCSLLPTEPTPNVKYVEEHDPRVADEDCELAGKLAAMIQSRQPVEAIKAVLFGPEGEEHGLDAHQGELLLDSLLLVGSKSMSHMLAVVEKYLGLFQLLVPKHSDPQLQRLAAFRLLSSTASFWRNSNLHFEFAVERLVNYRILLPSLVIEWIFVEAASHLTDPDCSYYQIVARILPRSLLLRTIQQASMMPAIALNKMRDQPAEKLASVLEKLHKDAQQTLGLAVQRLACFKDEVVMGDEHLLGAVERLCVDLIKEIVSLYPKETAAMASDLLSSLGRRAPLPVLEVLEQLAIPSH